MIVSIIYSTWSWTKLWGPDRDTDIERGEAETGLLAVIIPGHLNVA